ncbi:putative ABC transport system permease protein [Nocardia transvalensis]|uniref:Putative ABC transport system permease protein n=1 Tax=Nocardia transvalensis TaxID=37333 RepID=A0A7W9PB12_9NOCA|nr:FtsX-like permease family protein [Nocardia transvalensis]MBB5912374.1 putative ABC transport system permease protein [Nocardia transvalensis]
MAGNPMRKVTLRNLAAHKLRLALTLLSVILGTAFVAGSFVFTDTLQSTFDGIFAGQAKGVSVRVEPKEQQSLGVPNDVVDKVAATDGVRAIAPAVQGPVVLLKDGHAVQTGGAPSWGKSYLPPDRAIAEPEKFVDGVPPSKPGEIAINIGGADRAGLSAGGKATILVPSHGNIDVTVTGIYEFPSDSGGFIGVLFPDDQARQLFTDGQHVAYVDVAAAPGVSDQALRDRIAQQLPQFKVLDGAQVREDLKAQVGNALKFVNYFLLAFGAIALMVGTFIIYNTFSMIVAQRLRELALLRAVGASRRQVGLSVVSEAAVIGLIGSAIGLAGGVGLAFGLSALLNAFDLGLPTGTMQVLPRTVLAALGVGLAVTVASAYAPAQRAAKIPPVEAMRAEYASVGESLRLRTIIGAVLAVAGLVLVVLGARNTGGNAALTVGIGAAALIFAVLFASPAMSRPVVNGLGVLVRPFGPIGRMARNNAVRNPRRTAATAFALTLGLMLVSLIGMLGSSAKASVGELVDKGVKADYVLSGPQMIGVPLGAAQAAKGVEGVQNVVSVRGVAMKVGDDQIYGTSPSGPMDQVLNYEIRSGTGAFGENDILVSETEAGDRNWHAGDRVELTSLDSKKFSVTVSGIYKDTQLLGPMVVPPSLYNQVMPVAFRTDVLVLIEAVPGADLTAMRAGLEKATAPYVVVQVQDREDFKGAQGKQINTMLAILYGLLALAVVIAVLGIVNTLALSVVERRREIGMLRAVGMQRPQVRRTIYLESMLIAVFGAVVGVVLGLGLGVGFLRTLRDLGLSTIAVPWSQIVLMLVGSGVVGVLAALWPGVRAARTPPLAAIADM